ncbi:Uncharacterized protein TCM_007382 [Theobroma cacao]|uniref:Uncharacterized protein n=1 Tax=Theobroma cacao TaxID=3641 RepID=A0A061E300_THECC|nr:Uncharacterized protein TCM_007382 [Theobroma cacao]
MLSQIGELNFYRQGIRATNNKNALQTETNGKTFQTHHSCKAEEAICTNCISNTTTVLAMLAFLSSSKSTITISNLCPLLLSDKRFSVTHGPMPNINQIFVTLLNGQEMLSLSLSHGYHTFAPVKEKVINCYTL